MNDKRVASTKAAEQNLARLYFCANAGSNMNMGMQANSKAAVCSWGSKFGITASIAKVIRGCSSNLPKAKALSSRPLPRMG